MRYTIVAGEAADYKSTNDMCSGLHPVASGKGLNYQKL